jgi:hypothetical protein
MGKSKKQVDQPETALLKEALKCNDQVLKLVRKLRDDISQ